MKKEMIVNWQQIIRDQKLDNAQIEKHLSGIYVINTNMYGKIIYRTYAGCKKWLKGHGYIPAE